MIDYIILYSTIPNDNKTQTVVIVLMIYQLLLDSLSGYEPLSAMFKPVEHVTMVKHHESSQCYIVDTSKEKRMPIAHVASTSSKKGV